MADEGPESGGEDREEKPTEKRREDAREQGRVAQSKDLTTAAGLAFGLTAFVKSVPDAVKAIAATTTSLLGNLDVVGHGRLPLGPALEAASSAFSASVAPVATAVVVGTVAVGLAQSGIPRNLHNAAPKLSHLNLPANLGQLLNPKRAGLELARSFLKVGAIGLAVGWSGKGEIGHIFELAALPLGDSMNAVGAMVFRVAYRAAAMLFVLAVADYALVRWRFEKSLKMSREELKREMKDQDGDPHIKRRQRQVMREAAKKRQMSAVPKADVILVNPTHYSVALRYRRGEGGAPRVVAKGVDAVAARIRELGRRSGVPIVENPPLARLLYAKVRVGREVPADLYKAVAEVLAFVYRVRGVPKEEPARRRRPASRLPVAIPTGSGTTA